MGFQTPSYAITKTPNLDYLAHGGVVFTNHHVQPFCSPTRAALQTGRHVLRYGLQNTVIWPQDPWALPLNETFLAENLKDAGYYTGYYGKCPWITRLPPARSPHPAALLLLFVLATPALTPFGSRQTGTWGSTRRSTSR